MIKSILATMYGGLGVFVLLLIIGIGRPTSLWFYYVFYPLLFGGVAMLVAGRLRPRYPWLHGMLTCLPALCYWGPMIRYSFTVHGEKLVPLVLTLLFAAFGAEWIASRTPASTDSSLDNSSP